MNLFTRTQSEKRAGSAYKLDGAPSLLAVDRVSSDIRVDGGNMSATAIISTPVTDRDGDVIIQEGLDFTNYKRNPVVFFNHQAWPLPVGKSEDREGMSTVIVAQNQTVATCYFSQHSKEAEQVFSLVADGTLRSTSVGFLVKRATPLAGLSEPMFGLPRQMPSNPMRGYRIDAAEVTEWSWVGIGANPEAVLIHLSKGMIAGQQIEERLRLALQPFAATKSSSTVRSGWDPDQHPRGGDPANAGHFSSGGGSRGNNNIGDRSDDSGQGSGSSNKPEAGKLPNAGSVGGSSVGVEPQGGEGGLADNEPMEGLPKRIKIEGLGVINAGPHPLARQVARKYMTDAGLPYNPPKKYAKVNTERATNVARAFDDMEHAPHDPEVKKSYAAMVKETMAQWQAIKESGLNCEFIKEGSPDPYEASPRLATEDVRNNNHLWVFPTDSGFGSDPRFNPKDNPMLKDSGEVINGHKAVYNDIFRIVHDYFGHIKEGNGFRADGEENAWRSHSAMYSPLARRAMTAETRGQNSWVNYGPHGEHNRTALAKDTIFADQKVGLLPHWVCYDGAGDDGVEIPALAVKKSFDWGGPKAKMLAAFGAVVKSFAPIGEMAWRYSGWMATKSSAIAGKKSLNSEFKEDKHPRDSKGKKTGGQFAKRPGGSAKQSDIHDATSRKFSHSAGVAKALGLDEKGKQAQAHGLNEDLTMLTNYPDKQVKGWKKTYGVPAKLQKDNPEAAKVVFDKLDALIRDNPKALESEAAYNKMCVQAFGNKVVPIPPFNAIKMYRNPQVMADQLQKLSDGQKLNAQNGLKHAQEFRKLYETGEVDVSVTGKLLLWSILSRGVSPYTQEGLFIDAFHECSKWVDKAADGTLTEDDVFGVPKKNPDGSVKMVPDLGPKNKPRLNKDGTPKMKIDREESEYSKWAKSVAAKGSGKPGAGATHNLGAFGKNLLWNLSQQSTVAKDADGKAISHLQHFHNMLSDKTMTGKEIRRQFHTFGQGCGIDNKVVSFTLLVAGHTDVLILDRVQMRNLFDDGRFSGADYEGGKKGVDYNLYDGVTDKNASKADKNKTSADGETKGGKLAGSALNGLGNGIRGLVEYEAMEHAFKETVKKAYALLDPPREYDASIGRWHWESWIAASNQEASHGTIGAIMAEAEHRMKNPGQKLTSAQVDSFLAGVQATQGEYGAYANGARYGKDKDGTPYFDWSGPAPEVIDPETGKPKMVPVIRKVVDPETKKASLVPATDSDGKPLLTPERSGPPKVYRFSVDDFNNFVKEGLSDKSKKGPIRTSMLPITRQHDNNNNPMFKLKPKKKGDTKKRGFALDKNGEKIPLLKQDTFKVSQLREDEQGNKINEPWWNRPEVNQSRVLELAEGYALGKIARKVKRKKAGPQTKGYEQGGKGTFYNVYSPWGTSNAHRAVHGLRGDRRHTKKSVTTVTADALIPPPSNWRDEDEEKRIKPEDEETKAMDINGGSSKPTPPGMAYAQAAKDLMEAALSMQENPDVQRYIKSSYAELKRMCDKTYPDQQVQWNMQADDKDEEDGEEKSMSSNYEDKQEDDEDQKKKPNSMRKAKPDDNYGDDEESDDDSDESGDEDGNDDSDEEDAEGGDDDSDGYEDSEDDSDDADSSEEDDADDEEEAPKKKGKFVAAAKKKSHAGTESLAELEAMRTLTETLTKITGDFARMQKELTRMSGKVI